MLRDGGEYPIPDEHRCRAVDIPDHFEGHDKNLYSMSNRDKLNIDTVLISAG